MSKFLAPIEAVMLLLLFGSCDTSVNLSAPFMPRLVVYSVLTTVSDTQYVRVYTTYNSSVNSSSNGQEGTSVTDAQVTITRQDGSTIAFQPTVIEYRDSSGSLNSVAAYRAYPFRPDAGKQYVLTVSSPTYGVVAATSTIPEQGSIEPVNRSVLGNPFNIKSDFGFKAALSPEALGYLGQLYIEYLRPLPDGTYQTKRLEIPVNRDTIGVELKIIRKFYPQPRRRSTSANASSMVDGLIQYTEGIPYSWGAYVVELRALFDTEGDNIKFSKAIFYLIQFDAPLWKYWNISNGFNDRYSIRLDDPTYTNITGGVGLLGSVRVDSLVIPLPERLPHPAQ